MPEFLLPGGLVVVEGSTSGQIRVPKIRVYGENSSEFTEVVMERRVIKEWRRFVFDKVDLFSANGEKTSARHVRRKDFDAVTLIESLKNPFLIEIGGPTDESNTYHGFLLLRQSKLRIKPIQFNLNFETIDISSNLSVVADGRRLPIASGKVDAVFISCLDVDPRRKTFEEVVRVLKPGGLFVWQGTSNFTEIVYLVDELGLDVEAVHSIFPFYATTFRKTQ